MALRYRGMQFERGDRWVYRKKMSHSLVSQLPVGALDLRYLCAESPSPSQSYRLSSPPFPFFSSPHPHALTLPSLCVQEDNCTWTREGNSTRESEDEIHVSRQRMVAKWQPRPPGSLTVTSYTCHGFETQSGKSQYNLPSSNTAPPSITT